MATRKQHAVVAPTEHSERAGTKAFSPEARRAAKQVSTTKPYSTNHDAAGDRTPEGRHASHLASNGHQAGVSVGLDASKDNLKSTRGGNTAIEPVEKAVPFGRDKNKNQ
jgi:hypothetical protein